MGRLAFIVLQSHAPANRRRQAPRLSYKPHKPKKQRQGKSAHGVMLHAGQTSNHGSGGERKRHARLAACPAAPRSQHTVQPYAGRPGSPEAAASRPCRKREKANAPVKEMRAGRSSHVFSRSAPADPVRPACSGIRSDLPAGARRPHTPRGWPHRTTPQA